MSGSGKYGAYFLSMCGNKKTYATEDEAIAAVRKGVKLRAYKCPLCKQYHLSSILRETKHADHNHREVKFDPNDEKQAKAFKKKLDHLQEHWQGLR